MATSTIKQRKITSIPIPIGEGGTNATSKANAQTNLGIHPNMCINASTILNKSYSSTEATYTSTQDSILLAVGCTQDSTAAGVVKNSNTTYRIYDSSSAAGEDGGSVKVTIAAAFIKSGSTITYQRTVTRMFKLRA